MPPRRPNRASSSGSTMPTQRRATAPFAKIPLHCAQDVAASEARLTHSVAIGCACRSARRVSAPGARPHWSRSSDCQIMRPATLRPDSPAFATILPNFH
jgi:hypothetical protein